MVLSVIENKLQWLEQDLSAIAAPEGITLEAVRSSVSEMQEAIPASAPAVTRPTPACPQARGRSA